MTVHPIRFSSFKLIAACLLLAAPTLVFGDMIRSVSSENSSALPLTLNATMPITEVVTVQPIIVSNTDGTNTAEFFGTPTQQGLIEGFVDDIWAQAGIDILFLSPNTWNDTFANVGTLDPRPTSDLNTVVTNGDLAGVGSTDANTIDMYFVEVAAGFSPLSDNTAAGLAFVGAPGVTQFVGDNLPTFTAGQEVVASVVAHEIGHNLGLPHIVEVENLMQAGGSPNPGERLNASQITTALNSNLSVLIPEPSSVALMVIGAFAMMLLRFRQPRA